MKTLNKISDIEKQIQKIIDDLQAQINNLPDNDKINRLDKNCFVLSSKDLNNNWSAEYHDFKWQYQAVSKGIQNRPLLDGLTWFRKLIEAEKMKIDDRHTMKLNPEVIEHLKTLL